MSTPSEDVLYKKTGRIGTITINRPQRRNTVNVAVALEIYHHVFAAAQDRDLAVLVFRGQGADFCCGADIQPQGTAPPPTPPACVDTRQFAISELLHNMPAVTIAAIKGGCAGAGLGWACACDLRVADASVKFNTAFLDVGVAGDMGGAWFLSRIVGGPKARELYFFPRKFGADEALQMDLVTRVFSPETFEGKLNEMTEKLAQAAPLALRAMKANFVDADQPLASFIAIESARHIQLFGTQDRKEAFQAYLEKRRPNFEGR